jgi:hypothetical protein
MEGIESRNCQQWSATKNDVMMLGCFCIVCPYTVRSHVPKQLLVAKDIVLERHVVRHQTE